MRTSSRKGNNQKISTVRYKQPDSILTRFNLDLEDVPIYKEYSAEINNILNNLEKNKSGQELTGIIASREVLDMFMITSPDNETFIRHLDNTILEAPILYKTDSRAKGKKVHYDMIVKISKRIKKLVEE